MGADVYLNSVHKPLKAEIKPKFDAAVKKRDALPEGRERRKAQKDVETYYEAMYAGGYFRDSYNSANLASLIGFSWWRDIVPMLDDDSNLPLDKAQEFIALLESKPVTTTACDQRKTEFGWKEPLAEIVADYEKSRQQLIALLKQSIELKEPLYCSL